MAILASELVFFAAANEPNDDTSTAGGAIDTLRRFDFTQIAADDDIEVISSSASDTQNCTITARGADGTVSSQTTALTGTTAKIFNTLGASGVVNRVLKVELASVAIGTITVRRSVAGATLRQIPIGERGFMAFLREAASDPSATKNFWVKGFWKNTNGSLALTTAKVQENADPQAKFTHALETSVNGSGTSTNRVTTPGAIGTDDGTDKTVPGNDLAAGAAIGTWLHGAFTAADGPYNSTYTTALTGNTA